MPTFTFAQFQRAMLPVLAELREKGMNMAALAKSVKANPRPLTSAEFLLLVANECRHVYSRRERNYE